jgi:hypothetical protein
VYDAPTNSSYKRSRNEELSTVEQVAQIISKFSSETGIILLGDFNARTSTLQDQNPIHFDPESDLNVAMNNPQLPQRSSSDMKLNTNGKPFLNLIKENGIAILNGRTLGDVFGEMTCHKYNGSSVVDYVCSSYNTFSNIKSLRVSDLSFLSDHCPIKVSLEVDSKYGFMRSAAKSTFSKAPRSYKWKADGNTSASFQKAQLDHDIAADISNLNKAEIFNSEDLYKLNDDLTKIYHKISNKAIPQSKLHRKTNKKKWFDWTCREAKRDLSKAAKAMSSRSSDENVRAVYHQKKKDYKRLIKSKKSAFLFDINKRIESGSALNWKVFKQLKDYHKDEESFDTHDLENFFIFFKELYRRKCAKIDHSDDTSVPIVPNDEDILILNEPLTMTEIDEAITKLKTKKSVSIDLVSNEMLKHSGNHLRNVILRLFNSCLSLGIYPWNTSVTTPLHKKGDKEDPDNYRAITLGSCLGKLFSSILLNRLLQYRSLVCPDHANQLGFCKGSQTSDHILVLKTVIDKYVKRNKKRVYSCFVDYKKAFDRVCRQALMYKLSKLGIGGNFFKCLNNMYANSKSQIKLINKLSDAIDVELGTEQGHPLSPELFKIFVHDLSEQLNNIDGINSPSLNGVQISHLLWADDLVLMALDPKSLQMMLDVLHQYVEKWELEVNMDKTNVMVFNSSGRILLESHNFTMGNEKVVPTASYCYLGITFSLNGSFKTAIANLTAKGKRAFHQIKRTVDTRALSTKSLLTLFDALILPIISYAGQIWIPYSNIGKPLNELGSSSLSTTGTSNNNNFLNCAPKDPFELFHLKYLKWVLGLHKKASNLCCYGDTGRHPIALKVMTQCVNYFRRIEVMAGSVGDTSLVRHAFLEQKSLNLEWYNVWKNAADASLSPAQCTNKATDAFVSEWELKRFTQSKLRFYNTLKERFGIERYLEIDDSNSKKSIARLRASAHDLRVETGRYATKTKSPTAIDKTCRFCCQPSDLEALKDLEGLPHFDPILESEEHVLTVCPGYHHFRIVLSDELKCHLMLHQFNYIMGNPTIAKELGNYLHKCYKLRNPKSKDV